MAEVEDLGKAVTDPKEKSGPDEMTKKVKKAAVPVWRSKQR